MTQDALGSVHYISPEQARGEHIDARSDIYSAGVVLYEMLTGRLPFEGDSAVSVAIQHLSSVPLAPSDIREDVPKALELICMKAMCANINKRYSTATEMLEDPVSYTHLVPAERTAQGGRHGQRCAAEICDKLDEYAGDTLQRYGGIFVHPIQPPAVAGEKTAGDFAA